MTSALHTVRQSGEIAYILSPRCHLWRAPNGNLSGKQERAIDRLEYPAPSFPRRRGRSRSCAARPRRRWWGRPCPGSGPGPPARKWRASRTSCPSTRRSAGSACNEKRMLSLEPSGDAQNSTARTARALWSSATPQFHYPSCRDEKIF